MNAAAFELGAHLGTLSARHLQAACLADAPSGLGWNFEQLSDVLQRDQLREAAVLIGLVARSDGWHVLLTQRTEQLSSHAGQVSFPGGRIDENDAGPVAAALRECFEEVGIPDHQVEVIGFQPRFATISNFVITPVVAILDPEIRPKPQQSEVAAIFEAPLSLFLDRSQHREESREYLGRIRTTTAVHHQQYRIWGATASIMLMMVDRLREVLDSQH